MTKIKGHKPALVVGLFVAAIHAIWVICVALGVGQIYLDWIFPLHLIANPYTVLGFNFLNALLLIIVAFVCGYVVTWLFVWLWNIVKIKK